ncbi:hypothetical protein [Vreelandella venusta]|uniref:hypothetical protein n=1 Tax=Vreelandella venusta TaxID=44935 RepID=UPI003C2D9813
MKKTSIIAMATTFASVFSLTALAEETPEELINKARGLVSIGFDMSEYSSSSSNSDVAQCMDMMQEHQPQAEELLSRIASLPYSVSKSNLDMAAIDLQRCLSCVPDAVSSCEAAETLVDTAEQYLN